MRSKNVEDIYPLSHMQQGILFHARSAPDTPLYFVQWLCQLRGDLDVPAFQRAWQVIINRHASLRAIFVWEDLDEPLQVIRKQASPAWTLLDWRALGAEAQPAQLEQLLLEDQRRGFDLAHAPLMRFALIRSADDAYQLVWSFHHLLVDGWSILLLLQEVFTLYRGFSQGQEPALAPAQPYRNYIAWQQRQELAPAEAFWRKQLAGFAAPTPLPIDRALGATSGPARYTDKQFTLPAETTAALQSFARRHQLTLNTLAQSAWAILLQRYSGQDDVVFGATVAGRPAALPGVEQTVGLFINTLPVRARFTPDAQLLPWLQQLQQQQIAARQYEYSPLVHVQRWSAIEPGQPLFSSLLSFENYPGGAFALDTGLANLQATAPRAVERVSYPLNLSITLASDITLKFIYDTRQFDEASIDRLAGNMLTLLEQLPRDADRRLADLPFLSAAEQQQVAGWNATAHAAPRACLHQLFEQHADRAPDATALAFGSSQMSYGKLERRANQLAHYLRAQGVGPETLVGISTERSFEMLVGVLGVLKAGGAFVPLDPTYPQDRLAFMVADSGTRILLTQEKLLPIWEAAPTLQQRICLDRDWPAVAAMPATRIDSGATPTSLAYVIYTSGSTGRPKGVLVEHAGIGNLITSQAELLGVRADDRVLQFAALSFDASVFEIAMALGSGAALHLARREDLLPGPALLALLREQAITTLTIVPSALAVLPYAELPALRRIIVAGEACYAELVTRWQPGRRFFNAYGPTEATIWSTVAECVADGQTPTIGQPIFNTQVQLLDAWQRPVPIGAPGELYIGGAGLARGYLGRPELNAERFIASPFGQDGARLYRSGDLARYRPDGKIEFLGRIDQQVKVRGFRIELGEIEAALRQHPATRDAAVIVREDTPGDARLVAYVVLGDERAAPAIYDELRAFVRQRLPAYMVPASFVALAALPQMSNGKLDRRALPAPAAEPPAERPTLAPQSAAEQAVAAIWRKALRVEQVGRHDNFFDLGGHSLLLGQIHSALQIQFSKEIALVDLFTYTTVSSLAAYLSQAPAPPVEIQYSQDDQARAGRNRLRQLQSRRER